ANGLHFRNLEDQALGDEPDPIGLGERYPWADQHRNGGGALVERGQNRSGPSAMSPTRLDSASDIPGRSSIEMVSVPSLKGGRNERGSSEALKPAVATANTAAVMTNTCCPKAQ